MYGKCQNLTRVCLLYHEIAKTTRVGRSFHLYLRTLKGMSDELSDVHPLTSNLDAIKRRIEEDMIFKVLLGFGQEFNNL